MLYLFNHLFNLFTKQNKILILASVSQLSSISFSVGSIQFDSNTYSYDFSVSRSTTSIVISASKVDSTATIRVNGQLVGTDGTRTVSLDLGSNTVTVASTAQDGTTTSTYTFTITRALCNFIIIISKYYFNNTIQSFYLI